MRMHRRGRQSGLTLIELLVTIIIAGIAFAAIVPVVVQALQAGQGDRARALALSVAQDRIEKVRELGYEELTTANLQDPDFHPAANLIVPPGDHAGLFGPTTTAVDGTTDRVFDVKYLVTEWPVSLTDARVAYKTVTVTVDWRGAPYPHKSVSLSTVVYRQSAGPRIIDAGLDVSKLDVATKTEIAITPVRVSYFVDEADLPTMERKTFGIPPNQHTLCGRVEISVSPGQTFKVPYTAPSLTDPQPAGTVGRTGNEFYVYWASPAGGNGAGDGYYSFSARAFSTLGYVGEASNLIGSMKVETGPPPAVTNLVGTGTGTAGNDGTVNLQWTASTATDLDYYAVYRCDASGNNPQLIAGGTSGWTTTGTTDSGRTFGATYVYKVVAVDWVDKTSTASVPVKVDEPPTVAPAPPANLKADLSGTSVTLTWAASPSGGVAGYHVWMSDGTTSSIIATVASGGPSLTTSYDQGAGALRFYTVKAYRPASPDSAAASVAAGYPTGTVGTELWASVQTPSVVNYDISAKVNSVPSQWNKLMDLELWYLGPAGTSTAVQVGATQVTTALAPVFTVTSAAWNGQPAGVYQVRWIYYKNSNGNTSSLATKNFTCSGATGAHTSAQVAIP